MHYESSMGPNIIHLNDIPHSENVVRLSQYRQLLQEDKASSHLVEPSKFSR